MRSPIIWFGGKGNMVAKLLKLLPEHTLYVEVFGGGASLLFAKPPSPIEVYNDIDRSLYDFFTVLSDPELFEQFYHQVAILPYHRALYDDYRATWQDEIDLVKRTVKWFVIVRQSFSGSFGGGWSFNITKSYRGMAGVVSKWLSCLEGLPQIHARLQRVQIECQDWKKILETYDTPETLYYLDPPYIFETRRGGGYRYEMSIDDHRELVKRILKIKGKVMLSGYEHEIYKPLESAGWQKKIFPTACHAVGRTRHTQLLGKGVALQKQPRIEVVWLNQNDKQLMLL